MFVTMEGVKCFCDYSHDSSAFPPNNNNFVHRKSDFTCLTIKNASSISIAETSSRKLNNSSTTPSPYHTRQHASRASIRSNPSWLFWTIGIFFIFVCPLVDSRKHPKDLTRPVPSDDLDSLEELMEHPDTKYDPPLERFNETYLREKLGDGFDAEYMSITRPQKYLESMYKFFENSYKKNKRGRILPVQRMPSKLRRVSFRYLFLPDGSKVKTKVSRRQNKKLNRLLWLHTYCPVEHYWKDLGIRFWPRFLKKGKCSNVKSCSIPPGMNCKQKNLTDKALLRWYCTDYDKIHTCDWIRIRYPIVSECACAC